MVCLMGSVFPECEKGEHNKCPGHKGERANPGACGGKIHTCTCSCHAPQDKGPKLPRKALKVLNDMMGKKKRRK